MVSFPMTNVYVSLAGGLGNQLFQVAAGYAYAKKYNKNLVLNASRWNASQGCDPLVYRDTIFKNFKYGSPYTRDVIGFFEKRFNFDEIPKQLGSISLNGYFQSLKYFEDYKDDFIEELSLPDIDTEWMGEKSVAVHVRRGDYLQHSKIHMVCDHEYFKKNLQNFLGYETNIFSDSHDIVKDEFKNTGGRIIDGGSELIDLTLMSQHDNIICSNSSFSWWASLLGKKKKKIIVPKIWFKNFEEHNDIYRQDFQLSEI